MAADGTITIATELDESGLKKGLEGLDAVIKACIKPALEAVQTAANEIGTLLASGLAQGLRQGRAGINAEMAGLMEEAVGAGKKAAEIFSPSKKTARELGEPLAHGIGVGFQNGLVQVNQDIESALGGLITGLIDKSNALIGSVSGKLVSRSDSLNSLSGDAEYIRSLAQALDELASKQNKTSSDTGMINRYAALLNARAPELGIGYDANTGVLSKTTGEIEKYLAAREAELELNLRLKQQQEIFSEQIKIEERLRVVQQQRAELTTDSGVSVKDRELRERALNETEKGLLYTQSQLNSQLEISKNRALELAGVYQSIADEFAGAEAVKRAELAETQRLQEEADKLEALRLAERKKLLDEARADYEAYLKGTQNAFSVVKQEESGKTVRELADTLYQNQKLYEEWSKNLKTLAQRGLDGDLLEQLWNTGPQIAKTVQNLTEATASELRHLNELYQNGAVTAGNALGRKIGDSSGAADILAELAGLWSEQENTLESAVTEAIVKTKEAASQQVLDSKFYEIGTAVADGIALGLIAGTARIAVAAKTAAETALTAMKLQLGINSPSKRAQDEVGKFVALGYEKGYIDQMKRSLQAMDTELPRLEISARAGAVMTADAVRTASVQTAEAQPGPSLSAVLSALNTLNETVREGKYLTVDKQVLARVTTGAQNNDFFAKGVTGLRV